MMKNRINTNPTIKNGTILIKKNDFLFKFYYLSQSMNSSNIESFINTLGVSELEKNSLINIGKVLHYIVENQLSGFKTFEDRLTSMERSIARVEEEHSKLIEDNLKITQTNELLKNIDTTKIQEFNLESSKILNEVASPELKLTQITFKDYFIERGIDRTFTMKTAGVSRDIAELIKAIYKQAGLTSEEYILDPNANDIQRRKYLEDGFEFMKANLENNSVKNARVVDKKIYEAYLTYTNPNA